MVHMWARDGSQLSGLAAGAFTHYATCSDIYFMCVGILPARVSKRAPDYLEQELYGAGELSVFCQSYFNKTLIGPLGQASY